MYCDTNVYWLCSVTSKELICHTIQVMQMRTTHLNMVAMLTVIGEEVLVVEVVDFLAGHPWVALGEGTYSVK